MKALLLSIAAGALGEIGDKTQLLTMLLVARFKRPAPVVLGLFVATLANYTIAGLVGKRIGTALSAESLRWSAGVSFLAIALLTLRTTKLRDSMPVDLRYGVFALTVVSSFLAEMGDKTQLATVVLVAKYGTVAPVVAGMTLGVIAADAPLILLARAIATNAPFRGVRFLVAGLFAALGLAMLLRVRIG